MPSVEIAVMGAKGASEIIFKKEINESDDPIEILKQKEEEYKNLFQNPYIAAARGYIDDVILPEETRMKLIKAFAMLENKDKSLPNKKHGNIPL
ncbi:MAG: carboxyl transferase domain-containing protein [Saprospiraceae bacterium]